MTMISLQFEVYLSNEETVRLLGVYHEARRIAWETLETIEALEARKAQWEAWDALEAHCIIAHGPEPEQTWVLYRYWRDRQWQ